MPTIINGKVVYAAGEALPTQGSAEYKQAQSGVIPAASSTIPPNGRNEIDYSQITPKDDFQGAAPQQPGESTSQYQQRILNQPFGLVGSSPNAYVPPPPSFWGGLPFDINSIQNTPAVKLPQPNPQSPGLGGLDGMLAYYKSLFDTNAQQMDEAKRQKEVAKAQQVEQSGGFFKNLMNSKSPDQVRAEANQSTGIDPQQYFAQEKAQLAEIGALNERYNGLVKARDQQIATTQDKFASTNFISNQVAQINRNAAPAINEISANINSKAAVLQASQGMFAEAQKFVNQAVDAATASLKYNFDMFKEFYSLNQDTIDKLDTKYQSALKGAEDAAGKAYAFAYDEKRKVGDLMIANPQANISINDTLDQATQKLASNPKAVKPDIFGSAEGGYSSQVYDPKTNTWKVVPISGGTNGGGGGGSPSNFTDVMQAAIDKGATPEEAARAAASISEQSGIPVDQKTLTNWTTQARGLKKVVAPVTTKSLSSGLGLPTSELRAADSNNRPASVFQTDGFWAGLKDLLFN